MSYLNSPFSCGVCGKKLAASTLACPQCGADEQTGLREETWDTDAATELGFLDDEAFDYDAFLQEEFGTDARGRKKPHVHPAWWFAAVVLLVALLLAAVVRFR